MPLDICPQCLRQKQITVVSGRKLACNDCQQREAASKRKPTPKPIEIK